MKPFLRWRLLAGRACAQSPDALSPTIERLPAEGLLLSDGWRYRAGDNPAWARPDLDDSRWDTLSPARPRSALPPCVGSGLGWLRLHLALGDSLRLRPLLLQASYLGATELYLNGHLLRREGQLSAAPRQVRPAESGQLVSELPAAGPAKLVLAVRFAPWQPPLLRTAAEQPLLLRLLTAEQLRQQQTEAAASAHVFYGLAGVFLLLTLLHFVFFTTTPPSRPTATSPATPWPWRSSGWGSATCGRWGWRRWAAARCWRPWA